VNGKEFYSNLMGESGSGVMLSSITRSIQGGIQGGISGGIQGGISGGISRLGDNSRIGLDI